MRRLLPAMIGSLLLALALTSCGSTEESGKKPASSVRTADNGDRINDADVLFATEMVPHHAQALEMVDLTSGRKLSPELAALAEQIREAQAPEIQQLVGWLTEWGEEVPATSRDHVNSGHDADHLDQDMPGMMSPDDMDGLEAARGAEFESKWLAMMAEHHQGAIAMARAEQAGGLAEPVIALAEEIVTGQEQELSAIRKLQRS